MDTPFKEEGAGESHTRLRSFRAIFSAARPRGARLLAGERGAVGEAGTRSEG
jgi:hypothetical protein